MSIQGILLILAIILVFLAIKKFKTLPPADAKKFLFKLAIYAAAGIFVLAAITGRVHWLMGILGAMVPLAQRLWRVFNTIKWLKGNIPNQGADKQKDPQAGQQSEVTTPYLHMRLHLDSGKMFGDVLDGPQKGESLERLNLQQLLTLYEFYQEHHSGSAKLLASYLNHYHPDWQQTETPSLNGKMSIDQAHEILGLQPPIDVDTVRQAHRRLIQKLHPDRGGSSYLASQINRAKDILLEELGSN